MSHFALARPSAIAIAAKSSSSSRTLSIFMSFRAQLSLLSNKVSEGRGESEKTLASHWRSPMARTLNPKVKVARMSTVRICKCSIRGEHTVRAYSF